MDTTKEITMSQQLPSLALADWQPTRDTLHQYARMMGKIRSHYMPKSKHWWHITLNVSARGLTTTPFPIAGRNIELTLDLSLHQLVIDSSDGRHVALSLANQSEVDVRQGMIGAFAKAGIELETDLLSAFNNKKAGVYDVEAVNRFHRAISWIDGVFKTFKGGLREETSPVQIFPHHMDLAMNWFSGRLVPGVDPADEENADEQLNFGFVTGDGSIDDAYFYATAYPVPEGWSDLVLPQGAYWHTEGWTGAILPYAALLDSDKPQTLLLEYLQAVQQHGAKLMV
ncbi:DUF5996 family protein [Pseudomonadota bacterium]